MYKSHEVAEGAFVGSMARHGPIFMDGVCVVLDRRKEWRERLRWGLLVFLIVDVEVGGGENRVSLNRGGCCCVGRVKNILIVNGGGVAGDDVSRDVSRKILGLF